MAYYDDDDSDDSYGSWDYDDFNDGYYGYWYDDDDDDDDYQYDGDNNYDDDYDDDDDDDDDDPWDNTLTDQGECDIVVKTMKIYKMNVQKYSPNKLKYFTVRGEGLFECGGCDNRWTSHNASIKVDLFKKCVSRKFKQRCKFCPNHWATPYFTADRFEEIMDKVVSKYESRLKGTDHDQPAPSAEAGYGGKPHMQEHCEKCQLQGLPCWKVVVDTV